MEYREEYDSMGMVKVPQNKLWGAQTQRSLENFVIGDEKMPMELIRALALVKKASALANRDLAGLEKEKCEVINVVCDEIIAGTLDEHFPLKVWQTGSGTQTNMNVNEVISNRAAQIMRSHNKSILIHPNDDVNRSQSTNDVFPTAMRVATYLNISDKVIPALEYLLEKLLQKAEEFSDIVKTGRTHLMDATPLTLEQEISAWASQIHHGIIAVKNARVSLLELPIGGTAVGSGLNAPDEYDSCVVKYIEQLTHKPFVVAPNKFEAMASHDAFVECHGALKRLAVSLMKIANDIRLLGSGPRCGIGELILPANEPGSSIMPGKVNPTQAEALSMVCAQIIGNDTAISIAGANGHLQLNVNMPVIIRNMLHSSNLLADAVISFADKMVAGIKASREQISKHLNNSLMLVTALNTFIGYEKAAEISKLAYNEHLTLKQATLKLGYLSAEDFDRIVDPKKMI